MSRKYKNSDDVPNSVLAKRLNELSDLITKGSIGREDLSMRVPAELDRDADLVLSEAARRLLMK